MSANVTISADELRELRSVKRHLQEENRSLRTVCSESNAGQEFLRHEKNMNLMREISATVVSELDLNALLNLVASKACEIIKAKTVLIPMINESRKRYSYMGAAGENAEEIIGTDHQIHVGMCGWVMTHEKPLLFGLPDEWWMDNKTSWETGMDSALMVPLFNKHGLIIGGLSGLGKEGGGSFTGQDMEILTLFANQVSTAIENALLFTELSKLAGELERRVAQRTQELSETVERLKDTQAELVQAEKMAALGQLIAGVAHEINTPLGAIRSSAANITEFLAEDFFELPQFFRSLAPPELEDVLNLLRQIADNKTPRLSSKEERRLRQHLSQQLDLQQVAQPDMCASYLVEMSLYAPDAKVIEIISRPQGAEAIKWVHRLSGLQRSASTITIASDRAAKIVFALKNFARSDHSGEKQYVDLGESIETVLTLYHNQLKHGIDVTRNYGGLPKVRCYPDELNQVWTNLIHNALQAMEYRGILEIQAATEGQWMKISFTDSGCGIPDSIREKIFQPFFTTKPAGEGSGLGLDIVRKIIDKHAGKIEFDSRPGRTVFHILLPLETEAAY